MRAITIFVLSLAAAVIGAAARADSGSVSGKVEYKGASVMFKYVYLVTSPGTFDPKATDRTLIFTDSDIGERIKGCDSVFCATGVVLNGMTVQFGSTSRITYWVVLRNQLTQISGTVVPEEVFKPRIDKTDHIAGILMIDNSAIGGPKANANFDVTLTKAFGAHP
jgi:hypothetical protein